MTPTGEQQFIALCQQEPGDGLNPHTQQVEVRCRP
jgi:hypothetical protein